MRSGTIFGFIFMIAGLAPSTFSEIGIHSDQIELRMDEKTGLVDLLQKSPRILFSQQRPLGSIQFTEDSGLLDITAENFPQLHAEVQGQERIQVTLPIPQSQNSLYVGLEIRDNRLLAMVDTQPIEKIETRTPPLDPENDTLRFLKEKPLFKEVTLFPELFQLRKGEAGDLVIPYQEGTLINASHTGLKDRNFNLFENSGITMPFWGISTPEHSEICIIDSLYASLSFHPGEQGMTLRPRFYADPYHYPIFMQIEFLGKEKTYIDIAKSYRRYVQDRNELPSLAQKLQQKPQLIHLLEGVNIKFPIYMSVEQRPDANGNTPPPRIIDYQRFEDVRDILADMKKQGMDRAMAVWWGWSKEGYDRLHPDILPPRPELGGEEVFAEMNRQIHQLGYAVGFHDNYTDIYEAAPSFDQGAHCLVNSEGKNQPGGFWAGGQCWLLCSTEGLRYAKRNFEAMKNLGPINACFVDVLTAAPVFDCYSTVHPHSKWGDRKNKRDIMQLVADHFGIMGTEHGFSWGADLCDYFEGITNDPSNRIEYSSSYGTSVPLFAAVYHDAILQYMHQGAPVNLSSPDRLLVNLRAGGSSYFHVIRREYENPEWKEYFLRAYRVSANTIRRTWNSVLTSHRFLTPDNRVEQCVYGDHVMIVINRSDQEFQGTIDRNLLGESAPGTEITLAPHGFLVSTPDYAALNGSRWGSLQVAQAGWYSFLSSNDKTLAQSDEIQIINDSSETKTKNDPAILVPKGNSIVSRSVLIK